ncbi:MAG: hypothetical protein ACK4IS_00455 [Erythrobacter sp.]
MTQDELEEELFLAILKESRKTGDTKFELAGLCDSYGITASHSALVQFRMDNDPKYGSNYPGIDGFYFVISAEGIRHARRIEDERRAPTLIQRIRALPIGSASWDIFKLGLGVILGVVATKYFG